MSPAVHERPGAAAPRRFVHGSAAAGSYLAQTGADLAFENAGGIRGGIAAGDVTAGDLVSISPYGNTLATYELTGAEILTTIGAI